MKPAAYLVECPVDSNKEHAVFLDVHRATDYAARHRGIVIPLKRYDDKFDYRQETSHSHGQ